MIKLYLDNTAHSIGITKFPDGAINVELPRAVNFASSYASVSWEPSTNLSEDFQIVAGVKDVLDTRAPRITKILCMPYIPYARADRRFGSNQSFMLKVFATQLNALGFDEVIVDDPHSDVATALIDKVTVVEQSDNLKQRLPYIRNYMGDSWALCAPDLGAAKKIFDVHQRLTSDTDFYGKYGNQQDWVQAVKIRDVQTGNIVKASVVQGAVPENILIVDDICDGGASFQYLAKELKDRGAKRVGLFVTHGIFSKGLEPLSNLDFVCASYYLTEAVQHDRVTKFNAKRKGNK